MNLKIYYKFDTLVGTTVNKTSPFTSVNMVFPFIEVKLYRGVL